MGKTVSNILLGALAIALMVFTGSRTLDLLAWALPVNQQIYQWLGLCAFEGGMLFWSFYFIKGAKGAPQRSVSAMMACFSIIAVSIATVGDLNLDAAQQGKIAQLPPTAGQALVIFLGVVIVVNVAAYMACHLLSVENMRQMKEQDAEDKIYDAGLRAITALAPSIASDAAPHVAEAWANRTWQRVVPGVPHQTRYIGPARSEQQSIDTPRQASNPDAVTNRPGKVEQVLHNLNPFKEKQNQPTHPKEREIVDTTPAHHYRKPAQRKFTPAQRPAQPQPKEEVQPQAPLAQNRAKKPLPVKKGSGPYKVNKKPMPKLHLND